MNTLSGIISLIALPLFMAVILILALIRKVDAYQCFAEGARGGIGLCIRTLPHIIAMMVAARIFEAAGGFAAESAESEPAAGFGDGQGPGVPGHGAGF